MAVSVHRNLSDLLMSWLAKVYTPWNAACWLGDASDRLPGVNSFKNVRIIIQTYHDFVQHRWLWFPRSTLVAQNGSDYAASSCSQSCFFKSILTRKTNVLPHES